MNKKTELFLKVFNREWNKRFQLVNEDGTPLELPKEKQDDDGLSEEGLSEKELEEVELTDEELEEMELMEDIGNYLDSIVEKLETEEEGDGGDK